MCRSMACTRRVGAAANVATGLYAWVDLKDWTLAGANAADAACCGTVVALTIASRGRWLVAQSICRTVDCSPSMDARVSDVGRAPSGSVPGRLLPKLVINLCPAN
jgi:hypothetical protein